MPISLSMYLYKKVQEKSQHDFEKRNKLLNSQDIKKLLESSDKNNLIKIFKSAVVDHEPVNGIPYNLMPPLAPLFYHDNFKRCMIANAIGEYAGELDAEHTNHAITILDALCDSSCAGYVQLFAWNALGRWLTVIPDLMNDRKNDLLNAMSGSTASLLGAIVFLDKLCLINQKQQVLKLIEESREHVKYKAQQALFSYFLIHKGCSSYLESEKHFKDKNMRKFIKQCQNRNFSLQYNFEEGAREIGLIPWIQKDGLQPGTEQADICLALKKFCFNYVSAIGFYLKTYWD